VGNEALLEKENVLFQKEYDLFFTAGETKPRNVGEPFFNFNPSSKAGVLLLHGLMAAPEEVRQWADFFVAKGLTVYAPRLAGHGTSPADLAARSYKEWIASVDRGYDILKPCCEKIVVAGFSTGAGIALYQATRRPEDYEAVISISAPLKFKGFSFHFVELMHGLNCLFPLVGLRKLCRFYAANHPDNPEINYNRCPLKSIVEVRAMMRRVYKSLPDLAIPSLIMQGKADPKVDKRSGTRIFNRIKNADARYRSIDFHRHGVIRGDIAISVFKEVETFIKTLGVI
jgi:carboxylesterase